MSQNPPPISPPGSAYSLPGPSRTNGLAIASLVCSVAGFCVLFVGGLLGVILGVLGLAKTRNGLVGGRGMAITGIVVGVLSILTSIIISFAIYAGVGAAMRGSAPARNAARQFVIDLSQGNLNAAASEATPDISPAELATLSQKLQSRGSFVDMTSSQFSVVDVNGVATCSLSGVAKFSSGDQPYSITLVRQGSGIWKVSAAQFP
jgi:hypothetical protein